MSGVDGDLGLIFSEAEIDQIISGGGTPPSIAQALKEGKTLRRLKRDSIYSTHRFTLGVAAAGNVAIGTGQVVRVFVTPNGQAGQGFVPALTFAQTNLTQSGKSPFSGLFVARRLNINIWSTSGDADNNQADEAVDTLVQFTPLQIKKGTSFVWEFGPVRKGAVFQGSKLYSVRSGAVGYGIGNGYALGVPFVVSPEESLSGELRVPDPAVHGLTLPATYVVDVQVELDGDAVEIISQ